MGKGNTKVNLSYSKPKNITQYGIKIAMLNINGINLEEKQKLVHQFIIQHKIHVLFMQEHNIKVDNKIDFLMDNYLVFLNKSINIKGGTLILIDKSIDCRVDKIEMSPDSRILSIICTIYGVKMQLINVYAHSGNSMNTARDELFEKDLMYYLRHNISNSYLSGDWNCVLSDRDVSRPGTVQVSKSLTKLIRDARFSDVWHVQNRNIEYTYVRENYGSRIDRIYCNNRESIKGSNVTHISFSDHSAVMVDIMLDSKIKRGKYYWKLNVGLLDDAEVAYNFKIFWDHIKIKINDYENINNWWECYAKKKIKNVFHLRREKKK